VSVANALDVLLRYLTLHALFSLSQYSTLESWRIPSGREKFAAFLLQVKPSKN